MWYVLHFVCRVHLNLVGELSVLTDDSIKISLMSNE